MRKLSVFLCTLAFSGMAWAQTTYKHPLPIQVAGCQDSVATLFWDTSTDGPVPECYSSSGVLKGRARFPDASTATMYTTFVLPLDFDASATEVRIWWSTSATSGNVVWQLGLSCVNDAESDTQSYTTTTVTGAAAGTTNYMKKVSKSSWNVTGCTGELAHLKVWRDPTNGSDTIAADAYISGIELRQTITY